MKSAKITSNLVILFLVTIFLVSFSAQGFNETTRAEAARESQQLPSGSGGIEYYTISGYVRTNTGTAVSGVTVSNGAGRTTTTSSTG